MSKIITINSKSGPYKINFGLGLLQDFPNALSGIGLDTSDYPNLVFVCDGATQKLSESLAQQCDLPTDSIITVESGEEIKSIEHAVSLWGSLAARELGRKTILVAVGGGVIGDLVGFVAATFMRGVGLIHVPTTLTAQVDSSIGGKVAINIPQGKNLVGAIQSPIGVVSDPEVLSTLPPIQFESGLVEVIKIALLRDGDLYQESIAVDLNSLSEITPLIFRSIELKVQVVEQDEYEVSDRRIALNLGHTIGHAIEAGCDYHGITHGQGVVLGLVYEHLFFGNGKLADQIKGDFNRRGFWPKIPAHFDIERCIAALYGDKKGSGGDILMPCVTHIGAYEIRKVKISDLGEFIKKPGVLSF